MGYRGAWAGRPTPWSMPTGTRGVQRPRHAGDRPVRARAVVSSAPPAGRTDSLGRQVGCGCGALYCAFRTSFIYSRRAPIACARGYGVASSRKEFLYNASLAATSPNVSGRPTAPDSRGDASPPPAPPTFLHNCPPHSGAPAAHPVLLLRRRSRMRCTDGCLARRYRAVVSQGGGASAVPTARWMRHRLARHACGHWRLDRATALHDGSRSPLEFSRSQLYETM